MAPSASTSSVVSESRSGSGTFSRFSLTDVTSVPPNESPSEASKKMEGNWGYVCLTYPASLIEEKDELESIFKGLLPKDTCYYGCRELYQDGTCQYDVICDFTTTCDSKRWHYRDVRTALAVLGDHDEKINISPPSRDNGLRNISRIYKIISTRPRMVTPLARGSMSLLPVTVVESRGE